MFRLFLLKDKRTGVSYDKFIGWTLFKKNDFYTRKLLLWDVIMKNYYKERVLLKKVCFHNKLRIIKVEVCDGVF